MFFNKHTPRANSPPTLDFRNEMNNNTVIFHIDDLRFMRIYTFFYEQLGLLSFEAEIGSKK